MSIGQTARMRPFVCFVAIALTIVLAACGGGGGGGEPATVQADPPPPTLALVVDSLGRQVPEAEFGGSDPAAAGADGTAFDFGPLANAAVTVTDAAGKTQVASTDASGYYRVSIKGLTPPFIAKVKRRDGAEWLSASTSPVETRGFVTINLSMVTDKTLGYVADAANVESGAASAVTPVMLAANPAALVAAKARVRVGLAAPLTNAGLDPAAYDPVSTPIGAAGSDAHALFLRGLTGITNTQGRTAVVGTVAGGSTLNQPLGVAVDSQGNVLIADTLNHAVRKVSPDGVMTTLAGTGEAGFRNGTAATATFNRPIAVAADASGNVYVSDQGNGAIRKIAANGAVSTFFALNNAAVGSPNFDSPYSLAADVAGNVYFVHRNLVRKVDAAGVVSTVAAGSAGSAGSRRAPGDIVFPSAAALDGAGNLYVSSFTQGSESIVKITPGGVRSDVYAPVASAGSKPDLRPFHLALDAGGIVYATSYLDARVWKITAQGIAIPLAGDTVAGSRDGTGSSARFDGTANIAVDARGNILVADARNDAIRKVTPAGEVTTIAGKRKGFTDGPGAVAAFSGGFAAPAVLLLGDVTIDRDGAILVADTGNHAIRKISPIGTVSTLAGNGAPGFSDGNGRDASFNLPSGVAVDGRGNVFVGDRGNNAIRKISADGEVTTIAGNGIAGLADGVGVAALFDEPTHLAMTPGGDLYVSDSGGRALRKITAPGVVTTVRGVGRSGPAYSADRIVVDPTGAVSFKGGLTFFESAIFSVSADGVVVQRTPSVVSSGSGLGVDADGNLFYQRYTTFLAKLTPSGVETEFLRSPLVLFNDIAFDRNGNIVVADYQRGIIRIILP